jgi:hypothetical protein
MSTAATHWASQFELVYPAAGDADSGRRPSCLAMSTSLRTAMCSTIWNTMIDDLISEKFALSSESFLLYSLEHLPNGNFILLFKRFHVSFELKIVRSKVRFFQEGLHRVQFPLLKRS